MNYRVLIADDEANARDYLSRLVVSYDKFQLLDTKANGLEVVAYAKTLMPDILMLDIEMPGLNGIDTARKIMKMDPKCLIIFTTAYNEYAITAFEVEAIGYLLKPFSLEEFRRVADRTVQLLETREKANFNDQIERLWEKMRTPRPLFLDQIEVKSRGFIEEIKVEDIQYIQSSSEYVELVTSASKYLYRISLEQLAKQLPPHFHRVHRSYVINNQQVKSCHYLNNGTYQFQLVNNDRVTSSRSYQQAIQIFRNKQ